MIAWEEYQIEFLPPAQDGEEVLRRMEADRPDILVTDINMPFLNGVELVKRVKEQYPEVVILVLSGYDDFAYVKETLMTGAINYLLKPISKIDLIRAVSKALELISEKEENERQTLKAASLLQDRELSLLIEKEQIRLSMTQITGTALDSVGCSIMLIKIHDLQTLMSRYQYDMNYLSYSMKKKLREVDPSQNLIIFNYINRSNEFLVVNELDVSEQQVLALKMMRRLKEETDSPVTIAVSEQSYSMDSLHDAYVQSISVLMTRPYTREDVILFSNKEKGRMSSRVDECFTQEKERRLKTVLKTGSEKGLQDLLLKETGLGSGRNWDFVMAKQMVNRISAIFLEELTGQEASEESIRELGRLEQMADKVVESLDVEQLMSLIAEMQNVVLGERKSEITGNIRDCVKEAVAYIDENYFEELTLSVLADKYAVESSYFSKLFKQETGENLMLYIAGKRMEKAKELMRRKDINIAEVAFMVGYDDYTYFSKVFKKHVGVSPRDYRNRLFQNFTS
ncbi:MAG: helix-turn-helix domain-containing protein [Muribaculaceae bacterium]|nr:helix-turn-helix domain-containing protein [Muribaculaceae bacterium]